MSVGAQGPGLARSLPATTLNPTQPGSTMFKLSFVTIAFCAAAFAAAAPAWTAKP